MQKIDTAISALENQELIIFPCDTVWGLLGSLTETAAEKIIHLKQRDPDRGFVVLLPEMRFLRTVCGELSNPQKEIIKACWPNPITFILPKHPDIPSIITGGRDTIAVRYPQYNPLQALLLGYGQPVLSTSANMTGGPLPQSLTDIPLAILDNVSDVTHSPEPLDTQASTVVDLCGESPKIDRKSVV